MANMTYCQFENTLRDLYQVRNALREAASWDELTEDMSEHEAQAARDMPAVLTEMLRYYDEL